MSAARAAAAAAAPSPSPSPLGVGREREPQQRRLDRRRQCKGSCWAERRARRRRHRSQCSTCTGVSSSRIVQTPFRAHPTGSPPPSARQRRQADGAGGGGHYLCEHCVVPRLRVPAHDPRPLCDGSAARPHHSRRGRPVRAGGGCPLLLRGAAATRVGGARAHMCRPARGPCWARHLAQRLGGARHACCRSTRTCA